MINPQIGEEGFWKTFDCSAYDTKMIDDWKQELYNYFVMGFHPGSFHGALFSNELYDAACRSHELNEWQWIRATVKWLFEHAPQGSYGSRENVKAWLQLSTEERRQICINKRWLLSPEETTWKILEAETDGVR